VSVEPGSLARALRLLRASRGYSIARFSRISGLAQSQICDYEHGRLSPNFKNLCALVRALGYKLGAVDRAQEFDLGLEEAEIGEGAR
jgi:transcriptional regulator with XRE-family HTH domain